MESNCGNTSAHCNPEPAGKRCNSSDEYKFTVYTAVFSLVFVLGLLTNGVGLYVFFRLAKKNRLSTVFLINLAASDLLFIFTMPARIAFYMSESEVKSGQSVLELICRFSTYIFYISMYCSIYFLTGLSVCRYLVMVGLVRRQNKCSCRMAWILCLGIWVFVIGGNVSKVAIISRFQITLQGCFEPLGQNSWELLNQINLWVLLSGFVFPFSTILICFVLMIRQILRVGRGKRWRDLVLIFLVLLVFCACFLPYHVQRTLHLHHMVYQRETSCQIRATLQMSVVITLCIAVANSCLDPLIFLFVGQGFLPMLRSNFSVCKGRGTEG